MDYYIDGKFIRGIMPNGDWELFDSVEEYEDAYYDMMFEMNNKFQIEYPEYA